MEMDTTAVQILLNSEDDNCLKCNTTTPGGFGILLKACRHNFCKTCLRSAIHDSDGDGVKCPVICGGSFSEGEIQGIATAKDYKNYNQRSFLAATKYVSEYECQLKGCNGICEIPANGSSIAKCLVCSYVQCVNCAGVLVPSTQKSVENGQEESALLVRQLELKEKLKSQQTLINELLDQILAQNLYADEIQAWKNDFEKAGPNQEAGGSGTGPGRDQPLHLRLYNKFKDMEPVTQVCIVVGVGIIAVFIGASAFTFISWAWPTLEAFAVRMAATQALDIVTLLVNTPTILAVLNAFKEGKPINAELFKSLGADIISLISKMAPLFLRQRRNPIEL